MLARSDEELRVFERLDKERRELQQAQWRSQGRRGEPARLLTLDEIPKSWLEKATPREVLLQQEFDTHGRGQRRQAV